MLHSPQQARGGGLERNWHQAVIFNISFIQPAVRLLGKICTRLNFGLTCWCDLLWPPCSSLVPGPGYPGHPPYSSYANLGKGNCRCQCLLCLLSLARRKARRWERENQGSCPVPTTNSGWINRKVQVFVFRTQCFPWLVLLKSVSRDRHYSILQQLQHCNSPFLSLFSV